MVENLQIAYQGDNYANSENKKFNFGRCRICNDRATGIHYGIASCEGCKGFYKRSVAKSHKYMCFFNNKCVITPRTRRRCKLCRWRACVRAGMSFDSIKMGRMPKLEKEKINQTKINDFSTLSTNKSNNINNVQTDPNTNDHSIVCLTKATNIIEHFPFTSIQNYINMANFIFLLREKCHEIMKNCEFCCDEDVVESGPNGAHLDTVLSMLSVQSKSIVFYARKLPGFDLIDLSDLTLLLSNHVFKVLLLKLSRKHNDSSKQTTLWFRNENTASALLGKTIASKVLNFDAKIQTLELNDYELALLFPYIISSSDEIKLNNLRLVEELNEYYKCAVYHEFSINKRSQKFIDDLFQALDRVPMLI